MKHKTLLILAVAAATVAATATYWLTRTEGDAAPHRRDWIATHPGSASQIAHPRVAALAPGLSQILRDLGCSDLIVARHAYDKWADQSLPVCGDQQGVDYEKLIATSPTHVFVQLGETKIPERLRSLARERGWVVRNVPLLTLDDIAHATVELSASVVTPELDALRAEDAALTPPAKPTARQADREQRLQVVQPRLLERLDKAYAPDASLSSAGRVLLLYQGAGETGAAAKPAALGPGSYSHDILLRIGGQTATQTGKVFMPLDAEDVARLRPDAIVIVRPREPNAPAAKPSVDELIKSLGAVATLNVPAVKNRRVALIDEPMALIPGTNLGAFADALRSVLKGWAGPQRPQPDGK